MGIFVWNFCKTVVANEQVVDGKCERCGGEIIQKDLAQAISAKFPELCLAVRPDQSFSPNCLRATWFDPADYRNIRHLTFVNFWFAERPDIGASPMDFAIQYDKFVRYRNGEEVEFNLFGELIAGYY